MLEDEEASRQLVEALQKEEQELEAQAARRRANREAGEDEDPRAKYERLEYEDEPDMESGWYLPAVGGGKADSDEEEGGRTGPGKGAKGAASSKGGNGKEKAGPASKHYNPNQQRQMDEYRRGEYRRGAASSGEPTGESSPALESSYASSYDEEERGAAGTRDGFAFRDPGGKGKDGDQKGKGKQERDPVQGQSYGARRKEQNKAVAGNHRRRDRFAQKMARGFL